MPGDGEYEKQINRSSDITMESSLQPTASDNPSRLYQSQAKSKGSVKLHDYTNVNLVKR